MGLNRNPDNYFAEVEKAGFAPESIVSGMGLSPAEMLQRRFFAYADAHRYRVGTLATLAANAALVARSASKGLFSAAQYRDTTGIGRTRAIKILEFFDTLGITQRIGDARKMHKYFEPLLGTAKPALATTAAAGKDIRVRR